MIGFSVNEAAQISRKVIGREKQSLIIVDDFLENPDSLVNFAGTLDSFSADPQNFYPGLRKDTPAAYVTCLEAFLENLLGESCDTVTSMYAVVTKSPQSLKPVQSIPHFDTTTANQVGVVHYLCGSEHGGTSFYRHKSTGFECITDERKGEYLKALGREATTHGLPKPGYISGDTDLFERFDLVEAKYNRVIIYPSNLLHTGDVKKISDISPNPKSLRLTITSFVRHEKQS